VVFKDSVIAEIDTIAAIVVPGVIPVPDTVWPTNNPAVPGGLVIAVQVVALFESVPVRTNVPTHARGAGTGLKLAESLKPVDAI
jgi:hypothetical protein